MTRKIHCPPAMMSAGSRAGHPPLLLEIPSPEPEPSEPSQLLLACHMLKNWNERKHCVVFGLSMVGWGRVGPQPPGPHPAAWLNAGRKEVKAAASGRRNEILHLAQCSSPLCPCAPLSSRLVLQSTAAPVLATCTAAAMGIAWPAWMLNLNLVAGYATSSCLLRVFSPASL